jgi:hypothetical protein
MSFMEFLGPILSAAGPIAGGLLGGNQQPDPSTQTQQNQVADWLLPYLKAQVERQYNISNKPYQPYQGFFQSMAQAVQDEAKPAERPWDDFKFSRPGRAQNPDPQQFVDRKFHPINPLTAKPGEALPIPLGHAEYGRYMQNMDSDPGYTARTLNPAQFGQWKKDNRGLRKYMTDKPYQINDTPFNQSVAAQLAQKNTEEQPNIIDRYYAPRALKGLLG